MVMEVSAACHKNEGSREVMRRFVCWRMREWEDNNKEGSIHEEDKTTFYGIWFDSILIVSCIDHKI
jgi:hypothetical protein